MPLVVQADPDGLASVPGSAAPFDQIYTGSRVLVFDAAGISVEDLWGRAGGPLNADIVLTLVYDPALSRVRITATGMEAFTLATIERSTDQIAWTTVRGGDTVGVSAGTLKLDDYEFKPNVTNYYRLRTLVPFGQSEIASITPTLTQVWLKSVARPFLNLPLAYPNLGGTFRFEQADRGGVFPVLGRSLPVAVTDVRGSRQYTLAVRTDTDDAATALDLLLASGDILFLHAPPGFIVPAGGVFIVAGRTAAVYPIPPDPMRFTDIPVTEVAAPGPDVIGATSSWTTVLATYATWADVVAAKESWSELLELVADGSEILVP